VSLIFNGNSGRLEGVDLRELMLPQKRLPRGCARLSVLGRR
jgi:hypothetical protein